VSPNWFVAFPVDLGPYLSRLVPPRHVRLFASSDTHLTVAFLGAVSEDLARRAFAESPAPALPPTDLRFEGVALLGPRKKPSAVSLIAGGEGATAVAACMARLRDPLLAAAGAPPDARPPLPHVTVARVQRKAAAEERRAARAWAEALPLPRADARVSELALYTWSEDRAARLFRIVERRPLAPG